MTVTDNQQQLGKLDFKNEICKLKTSLPIGFSVLLNCVVKVHMENFGTHNQAMLGTQWQCTMLVPIQSSS